MEFRRAVRVSSLVVAVMATGCTAGSTATRSTEVYMIYQDLAGWSAEIPPGWKVLPFETSKGNASSVGTQISNVELPAPEIDPGLPIQTSGLVLPLDGVSLIIATDNDPKNVQVPESPPAPPLSMEDFAQGSATGGGPTFSFLWFEVSGNLLLASIKAGPQADEATLRTLVESIREAP
ncbi:MAG TPA: hypothetical protein VIQ27_11870 [Gemmatimonadales bacterium]|jgi:hypothetical protein